MIVYKKDTGEILREMPDDIDVQMFYYHYPEDFKNNLETLIVDDHPKPLWEYRIINEDFVRKSEDEILEVKQYGRELTNEERIQYKKDNLINASKSKLAIYLQSNPLQYIDGKYYSVTAEKQNLLSNAIAVYQMKMQSGLPAELKWNSTGEECNIWTLEGITALALTIASYVEPLVTYQQALEVQIKGCTTVEELDGIVIDYESV